MQQNTAGRIFPIFLRSGFGVVLVLCLTSCTAFNLLFPSPKCHQWCFQTLDALCPEYAYTRLFLPPKSNGKGLEMEIIQTREGLWFFANLLYCPISDNCEDPGTAVVNICFCQGQERVRVFRLRDGYKLLFPADIAERMINELLAGTPLKISVGIHTAEITPANFAYSYQTF